MSLITTLARMEAVATGRAQPAATVRHRHLSERPMVLVPLTTAGEAGAPLGALVGTDREAPRLLVVPQPRDRDLRFGFLAELAETVLPYLDAYAGEVETEERKETDPETGKKIPVEVELCADAPQLLVPSAGGVEFVRLLGRSMRFRRTAEQDPQAPYPAPPRVPLLGRWLTHYGERSRVPGASLLLSLTGLLSRHWATGQSNPEDQHLGALLAWIDPPAAESGAEAALRVELERGPGPSSTPGASAGNGPRAGEGTRAGEGLLTHPPAGPATDPVFDNRLLAPAMARYDAARTTAQRHRADTEIRELVASQLVPTWEAVWRGVDLLRSLPEGSRVPDRWKRDRWSYTGHRDRVRAGDPPQPKRDDAVTAAQKLAARETAQAQLDAQESLDDPLVMASRRLAGEAFAGEVTDVVMTHSEGKRPMPRPLVTIRTDDRPHPGEQTKVYRALGERAQSGELMSYEPGTVVVRLTGGMGQGREPRPGSVPEKGDPVCWTLFEHAPRGGPGLPAAEHTPWTHGGPPPGLAERSDGAADGAAAADGADPVTDEDLL